MLYHCKECNQVFEMETRRGRPPKYCPDCQETAPEPKEARRLAAQARVDRLEMMLRSRGSHPSQNRKDF